MQSPRIFMKKSYGIEKKELSRQMMRCPFLNQRRAVTRDHVMPFLISEGGCHTKESCDSPLLCFLIP